MDHASKAERTREARVIDTRQDEEGKDLGGAIEAGYDDEDMEEEQHAGTHEIEL